MSQRSISLLASGACAHSRQATASRWSRNRHQVRKQPITPARSSQEAATAPESEKLSDQLEGWLTGDVVKTLGSLIETFGDKSFAVLFVVLLGVPAMPLPTGGATHVFEVIAAVIALELIAGRRQVWLPQRWLKMEFAGEKQRQFVAALAKLIRRLERVSRPRLRSVLRGGFSGRVFGLLVVIGSAGAFFAPPFTGLDTLPALGVVLLSLGVLLEDFVVVSSGILVAAVGITLEIALGAAAIHGLRTIF
jgi:hypothetical protein